METEAEIRNRAVLERIDALEAKVDTIINKLDQAAGAWMFVKILGSFVIGLAVLYNSIHGYFK